MTRYEENHYCNCQADSSILYANNIIYLAGVHSLYAVGVKADFN